MNALIFRSGLLGDSVNSRVAVVLNNGQYGDAIGVDPAMRMGTVKVFCEYLECGFVQAQVAPQTISVNGAQFERLKALVNDA